MKTRSLTLTTAGLACLAGLLALADAPVSAAPSASTSTYCTADHKVCMSITHTTDGTNVIYKIAVKAIATGTGKITAIETIDGITEAKSSPVTGHKGKPIVANITDWTSTNPQDKLCTRLTGPAPHTPVCHTGTWGR